ncbi:hypothetical protein D3C72_2169220 [compost metagenome]
MVRRQGERDADGDWKFYTGGKSEFAARAVEQVAALAAARACNSMSVLLLNQSPFVADVEVTVDKDAAFPELFPINFFSVVHS